MEIQGVENQILMRHEVYAERWKRTSNNWGRVRKCVDADARLVCGK